MQVRPVRVDEWERLRAFRLRALASDPQAFGAALADEEAQAPAWWQARLASTHDRAQLVAEIDDAWIGMAAVVEREPGRPEVLGMWVAPEGRGRGAGLALLRACEAWARGRSAQALTLWVNVRQESAVSLYKRAGFENDGPAQLGSRDPTRAFQHMVRALGDPAIGSARQGDRKAR